LNRRPGFAQRQPIAVAGQSEPEKQDRDTGDDLLDL
jgi:hypothetical protein